MAARLGQGHCLNTGVVSTINKSTQQQNQMSNRPRVGLLGASGETGSSILNGLIEDAGFDIVAFVRPQSIFKPANLRIEQKGVQVRVLDLKAPENTVVAALEDIEILISAIGPREQLSQIPLVIAAKKAGIKRFVPCAFAPVLPVGVHRSRDEKEEVFNLIKRLHIPYTIIDVGWWYQFTLPRLTSGKIDYALTVPLQGIPGDGNVQTALTDVRDVGKYVSRAIRDERTLNTMVFAYGETWTLNGIYDVLERLSGEKVSREYTTAAQYEQQIAEADINLNRDPQDVDARSQKVLAQYYLSWGIRGENTPEFARYLGYLDGKKLYPDVKLHTFEGYIHELLIGKGKGVYKS
ncbi:hypothetical protein LLEC1_03549 [Akanthomyces lecanii]|uniref:NmrA-like domain-containing protein n=1 Tax=Cordyceps confragosa TaxID=2714763 RepID=A0A179I6C3_CORDF|nr:hypothetical protein LLEC1_03549 [Akanthomyces lecanii]